MINTYQIDVSHVLCCSNAQTDLDNLHNSFKYNIRHSYGYVSLDLINNTTATLHFSKPIDIDGVVDTALVDVIDEIVASYAVASFETLKNERIESIDANTRRLISQGAQFDGKMFSLSDNAQRNWIATKASIDVYNALQAWPVPITTMDDDIYLLQDAAHIVNFTTAMLFGVAKYYNSGRALKLQVKAATTVNEIRAIVDSRK